MLCYFMSEPLDCVYIYIIFHLLFHYGLLWVIEYMHICF